jgi:hypothetical protein
MIILAGLLSCKKDKENLNPKNTTDSTKSVLDSTQIPSFENPDQTAFKIMAQNIAVEKGRTVFKQNGNVLFYFDQNSNLGNIRIDGKDYALTQFDFTENNYLISGSGVEIEATNGDFKDEKNDCVEGNFPGIKVSLHGKIVNLTNITSKDCPNY